MNTRWLTFLDSLALFLNVPAGFPGENWPETTPAESGLDRQLLKREFVKLLTDR